MLDPYDCRAGRMHVLDGRNQLSAFGLGQAARNLIEQEEVRSGGQCARHFKPLAFEQVERRYRRIGARDQAGPREDFPAGSGGVALALPAAVHGADQQILEYGKVFERLRDLVGARNSGDAALMRARRGDVAAVEANFTAIRREPAGDQIEQRGLAGSIGADDPECLAARYREIEVIRRDH